jgi:hypothetical protein
LAAEWAMAVSGLVYCASRVGEITSNKGGHRGICLVARLDQVTAPQVGRVLPSPSGLLANHWLKPSASILLG